MKNSKPRILLFGGTFDPIHQGHIIISRAAADLLSVKKVILIPAAQPPHKDVSFVTDPLQRLAMVRAAVAGDTLFTVSDCELQREGPSYTLDTVHYFRDRYNGNVKLYWLIGMDSLRDLPGWHQVSKLLEQCTIVTAGRTGFGPEDWNVLAKTFDQKQIQNLRKHFLATPLVDISATEIRNRIAQGLSIQNMLPKEVQQYIETHGLYRPKIL